MQAQTRITRKGQRRQKHSEATVRELPTRRQERQRRQREAQELADRIAWILRDQP